MLSYQFYIIIGIVLIALEIVVPGFVLAPLGLAALLTGGVAFLSGSLFLQGLTFAAVSAALILGIRAWNKAHPTSSQELGTFGLVGQTGLLVERAESVHKPGRVKVFSDEFELLWDGVDPQDPIRDLEPGQRVRIVRVLGNKIVIHRAQGD